MADDVVRATDAEARAPARREARSLRCVGAAPLDRVAWRPAAAIPARATLTSQLVSNNCAASHTLATRRKCVPENTLQWSFARPRRRGRKV
jgi:hypothetical protein